MASVFSALDPEAMTVARALLAPPVRRERMWPPLAAAVALAVSSLAFAAAMILAPPVVTQHVAGAR